MKFKEFLKNNVSYLIAAISNLAIVGFLFAPLLKYEIKYYTNDEERTGWYVFHPLDDPDPNDIAGQELHIRYNKNKPWLFEAVASKNFD